MPSIHWSPPPPVRPNIRNDFLIDFSLAFLNHGSFGSTPRSVMEEQDKWRHRIEADPIEIIVRRRPELMENAKAPIGAWLGMRPADFGFITNATEGISCVLRSLDFSPGDELLTTHHVYNAIRQAMKFIAAKTGATYREIYVPLPVNSAAQIEEAIVREFSPRTKLLVIDHITSPTALVFPIERLIAACRQRNIPIMIDGAHGPGMIPLSIEKLDPDYYAGNLHKWACGPKGSAFLWVRRDKQPTIHPLIVSHFYQQGFVQEFGWQGTRDFSAWFAAPSAIEFMANIGWEKIMFHNHAMARWAHQYLCELWNVPPISPLDGSLLGSMATVLLPPPFDSLNLEDAMKLQARLHNQYKIEVPIMPFDGKNYVRPCCQIYNLSDDIIRLGETIKKISR